MLCGESWKSPSPEVNASRFGESMEMKNYYIGWDVGAWECSSGHNKSCDALVVMNDEETLGFHRDNMSVSIQEVCDAPTPEKPRKLIDSWFDMCDIPDRYSADASYFIAIDTPLGWPKAFTTLLNRKLDSTWKYVETESNVENKLLFRRTERELGGSLSGVVHAIGSQSTKGMALLCAVGAATTTWGVWRVANVTLFETYPKPCLRSAPFVAWMSGLDLSRDIRQWYNPVNKETNKKERTLLSQDDTFDAGVCACVARAFSKSSPELKQPPSTDPNNEQDEGWIFYPEGQLIQGAVANKYKTVVNATDVSTFGDAVRAFQKHVTRDANVSEELPA